MNLRIFPDRKTLVSGIGDAVANVLRQALVPAIGFAGPLACEALVEFARSSERTELADAIEADAPARGFAIAAGKPGDGERWQVSSGVSPWSDLGVSSVDVLLVDARAEGIEQYVAFAADHSAERWIVATDLVETGDAAEIVARWNAIQPIAGSDDSTWWFIDIASREALV